MATTNGLPLGPGPRPTTGAELVSRMRSAAAAAVGRSALAGVEIDGLDRASIAAELDGNDIESLELDLTGLTITMPEHAAPDGTHPDASSGPDSLDSPETSRTAAILRSAVITAHPALIADAPISVDLTVNNLPVHWAERADGSLELDVVSDTAELDRTTGAATVSMQQADLAPLVTQFVNLALADVGASVSGLEIALSRAGEDVADLDATARAKYGVMGDKVRFRATASIVGGDRIRLSDLDLSSSNLLAGALLGLAKGELEKFEGREFALTEFVPAELRPIDAHLDVTTDTVIIRASVGR